MSPKNSTKTKQAEQNLAITRVINAPRELVFKAWTDPEMFKKWWGPHGFTTPVCEIDFRPGGKILFCMRSPDGKDYWNGGVYRKIVEPSLIVTSDYFADEKGNKVSPAVYGMVGEFPDELEITIRFDKVDGKTRLTMEQSIPLSIAQRIGAPRGWNQSFDKLAEYLEKK
jgi:uncharacterized protein YndB with AHSA1/START domain